MGGATRTVASDSVGGRSAGHAHCRVLQRGRPPHALRARRRAAIPQRLGRTADAFAQKPAGQPAAAGEDRGQPPAGQLSGHRGDLPCRVAPTCGAGAGPRAHAGGHGPTGALCRRQPAARRAGAALAARGRPGGGVRAGDVSTGADCGGARLRAPSVARESGAGGRCGRRYVRLHRGATGPAAQSASRPQRRRARHYRGAHRRDRFRPQAQSGAGHASAGLPPPGAAAARGAQPRVFRSLDPAPDPVAVSAARAEPGAGAARRLCRAPTARATDDGAAPPRGAPAGA